MCPPETDSDVRAIVPGGASRPIETIRHTRPGQCQWRRVRTRRLYNHLQEDARMADAVVALRESTSWRSRWNSAGL